MVENKQAYGRNDKRIVFTETDHRHAQLIVKLKSHGMTQAKFFRSLITGYLEGDQRIENFILDNGNLSVERRKKADKYRTSGRATLSGLGLDEEQVDDLFDVIAEEFPNL